MTRERFAACFLLSLALLCAGCALAPDHVTIYTERSETASDRKNRTTGGKVGVSATFDLRR